MNDNVAIPRSSPNLAATLNKSGLVILVVGFLAASVVYWEGRSRSVQQPPPADDGLWHDSTLSSADSKITTRGIGQFGGPVQLLMVKFNESMKDPTSQALVIATTSLLVSFGCFLAARNLSQHVKA